MPGRRFLIAPTSRAEASRRMTSSQMVDASAMRARAARNRLMILTHGSGETARASSGNEFSALRAKGCVRVARSARSARSSRGPRSRSAQSTRSRSWSNAEGASPHEETDGRTFETALRNGRRPRGSSLNGRASASICLAKFEGPDLQLFAGRSSRPRLFPSTVRWARVALRRSRPLTLLRFPSAS